MRRIAIVAILAPVLATAAGVALPVATAHAQVPNIQELLQGLTTGNQRDDQALRDAFQRGYERGRRDEARSQRADRDRDNHDHDRYDPPRYPREPDRR